MPRCGSCDPSDKELAESRDVFGADPFLDVTLARRRPLRDQGPRRRLRRLARPCLSPDRPRRPAPGRDPAAGRPAGNLGSLHADRPRPRRRAPRATPGLKVDGRPVERLAVTLLAPEARPIGAIRSRLWTSAGRRGRSVEPSNTRLSGQIPIGAAPVVSNPVQSPRPSGRSSSRRSRINEESQPQSGRPPVRHFGHLRRPGRRGPVPVPGRRRATSGSIEAIAERQGSPADPALLIQKVGAKGQPPQELASGRRPARLGAGARFNTQSVDASLRWQVPEDGLYQVAISDLYASQRGDPRLTYRLLIRREQPDFRLVLVPNSANATDAVTVRAGGRTSAYVLAIRLDGFTGPIRVEAAELPPGVTLAPVVDRAGPGACARRLRGRRERRDGAGHRQPGRPHEVRRPQGRPELRRRRGDDWART